MVATVVGKGDDNEALRKEIESRFAHATDVVMAKHRDYGSGNISRSPGGAENGVIVRMHDKMERLVNLFYNRKGEEPIHESVTDTLVDLINYSAILLLVRDGVWPSE